MVWIRLTAKDARMPRIPEEEARLQINRIRVYQVALPLHEGSYKWSGGKSVSVFDCTIVEVLSSIPSRPCCTPTPSAPWT
jgi:hypothetical protein